MFETRLRKGYMNFNLNVTFVSLLASVFVLDDLFEFWDGIVLRGVDCNDP